MIPALRLLGIGTACVLLASAHPSRGETTPASSPISGLTALSKGDLGQLAGGAEPMDLALVTNQATNNSTVTGNTIGNIAGTGTISNNSMSATSGFTTLIANSGNQVSITQSTIVNVYLH